NLNSTLDQNFTVNSLTFSGTATPNAAGLTVASGSGTNALTINAAALNGNAAGSGITVNAGAGADTISANVVLATSQTWTNNSTSTLTVSGVISEAVAGTTLAKAGTGTIALNAANTFTGGVFINAGAISVTTLGSATT